MTNPYLTPMGERKRDFNGDVIPIPVGERFITFNRKPSSKIPDGAIVRLHHDDFTTAPKFFIENYEELGITNRYGYSELKIRYLDLYTLRPYSEPAAPTIEERLRRIEQTLGLSVQSASPPPKASSPAPSIISDYTRYDNIGSLRLTDEWYSRIGQGKDRLLVVTDKPDPAGDLLIEVLRPGVKDHEAAMFIRKEQARELIKHLTKTFNL